MVGYTVVITILLALYSAYMGYVDGANAIATSTVTHAFRPRLALLTSALAKFLTPIAFFFLGFMTVAGTISDDLISHDVLSAASSLNGFIFILSGLIASMIWGGITSVLHIPTSPSHTLIGGILGSAIAAFGFSSVLWTSVGVKVILMVVLAPVIGLVIGFVFMKLVNKWGQSWDMKRTRKVVKHLQRVNSVFLSGMFSLNNVQKSMGVFVLAMLAGAADLPGEGFPLWMVIVFSGALTGGLLLGGFRMINTIGRKIYKLRTENSLVAQITTSGVMIAATVFGIPVSTGQVMASSIMGVGASERISGVNWHTAGRIVMSWFLTLPIVALLGAAIYLLIAKVFLGGI